jgi:membrane fusion protein (multidrug efflux system)
VHAGDLLVEIDDTDAVLAFKQSEARLLKAKTGLRITELNYQRRKTLFKKNVIAREELGNAENDLSTAQAILDEAVALNDLAKINCQRTKIYSPISGVIAKRQVQLGQRVMPGNTLLSIVPLSNMYVNANFKENELRHIKANQTVILTSDKYGSKIKFHGIVEGFAGGTGSVFALIPSQNASGNWIKVVQRVPIRIKLVENELIEQPLEIGLSMNVKINLSEKKK